MATFTVTCVFRDRNGVTLALCNLDPNQAWSPVSVQQAIKEIEDGTHKYYAEADNVPRARIKVVDGSYLRTEADTTTVNNLDILPNVI